MALTIIFSTLTVLLLLWASTIRLVEPPTGQLMVVQRFRKHVRVFDNTPPISLPENHLSDKAKWAIRNHVGIPTSDASWHLVAWPDSIATSEFRYKKFRPLSSVQTTGGIVAWQPKKDLSDKQAMSPDTIVLGEWKEDNKTSLFKREREDIVISFRSKDGVNAVVKGYIKFFVWDVSAAISATYQFKADPEKTIADLFQNWAKDKKYFEDINGISFETVNSGTPTLLQKLNDQIYLTGVVIEDVELTEFIIDPDSKDVAEEHEKKLKAGIKLATATTDKARLKVEGEGERDKQFELNKAEQDKLDKEREVAVQKDKELKGNETAQYKKMKEIDVKNNGLLIDKLAEFKTVPDQTEIEKAKALGAVTGTLIYHEKGSSDGSNLDDKIIESTIIAQNLNKKGGAK